MIPPLEMTVNVRRSVDDAFRIFTSEIGSWWPMRSYSVGQDKTVGVVLEDREGGEFYELTSDGERHVWGTVTVWEPPHRVAFTWHPGRGAETEQQVELRFRYAGDVTEVALEHRGWEALGESARESRDGYAQGWEFVLRRAYKDVAERQEVPQ